MISAERRAEWESQKPPKPNSLYEESPALWTPKSCAGKRQPSGQAAGAVPFTKQDEHLLVRNPQRRSAGPAVGADVEMIEDPSELPDKGEFFLESVNSNTGASCLSGFHDVEAQARVAVDTNIGRHCVQTDFGLCLGRSPQPPWKIYSVNARCDRVYKADVLWRSHLAQDFFSRRHSSPASRAVCDARAGWQKRLCWHSWTTHFS